MDMFAVAGVSAAYTSRATTRMMAGGRTPGFGDYYLGAYAGGFSAICAVGIYMSLKVIWKNWNTMPNEEKETSGALIGIVTGLTAAPFI